MIEFRSIPEGRGQGWIIRGSEPVLGDFKVGIARQRTGWHWTVCMTQ